jgi:hypothetical protein
VFLVIAFAEELELREDDVFGWGEICRLVVDGVESTMLPSHAQ